MNICVGITSYLPDDEKVRETRIDKLINLITTCDNYFKVPIMIIAQNWKDFELPKVNNLTIYLFKYKDKLGITNARETLRKTFIKSEFDYIIMMDDDSILTRSEEPFKEYLKEIESTKKDFYYIHSFYLRFCCISKDGFERVPFDLTINAELGSGWEDVVFNKTCIKLLSNKELFIKITPLERSEYCNDKNSTWECLNKSLQSLNSRSTRSELLNLKSGS